MFYRLAGIYHTSYASDRQLVSIRFERVLLTLLVLAAASAPVWLPSLYLSGYLLPWVIWSTVALSLNFLMGWAGQIHLGYAAVMAIGAYTSIHLARAGVPFVLTLVGAGLVSAVVGLMFGASAMRVKGLYLAVSTMALQYLVEWVIVHVPAISGGAAATLQAPRPRLLGVTISSEAGLYWIALAWCMAVTLFLVNIRRMGFGRALVALRDKDYAASIIGINTYYYKTMAFWVSSFLGGVNGAILAFTYYRAVTPEQFGVNVSIQALAMVIVGGLGSVIGSFFGAGFVFLLPILLNNGLEWAARTLGLGLSAGLLAHAQMILYGGLIIFFLLVEPLGLAKIYDNVRNYFLVWPFGYTRRHAGS